MHSEFNVSPSPHLELVGQTIYVSGDVHPGDVDNDEELNFHLAGGRVPTVDTIYRYEHTCFLDAIFLIYAPVFNFNHDYISMLQ